MDWSRAKTILILAFLLLDLFLGYQLWQDRRQQNVLGQITQLQVEELKQKLKQEGIVYPEDLTDQMPEMRYMNLSSNALKEQDFSGNLNEIRWENDVVQVQFKNAVQISPKNTDQERNEIIQNYIHFFDQYAFDPMLSTDKQWIFLQKINDYPVFTSSIKIDFSDAGWSGYKQSYYQPTDPGVSRKVVSAFTALTVLLDNEILQEGEEVKQVILGYYIENYDADVRVLVPVWRVIHTNGIHYVNGFTGTLIGASDK